MSQAIQEMLNSYNDFIAVQLSAQLYEDVMIVGSVNKPNGKCDRMVTSRISPGPCNGTSVIVPCVCIDAGV